MKKGRSNSASRTIFAGFLTLTLVMGSLVLPAQAEPYADVSVEAETSDVSINVTGGEIEHSMGLSVYATDGYSATVNVIGDLVNEEGERPHEGIGVTAELGGTATVNAGGISGAWDGFYVQANDAGTANVTVGDVNALGRGVISHALGGSAVVTTGDVAGGTGIHIYADEGNVTLQAGDVTGQAAGIFAESRWGSNVTLETGNVQSHPNHTYHTVALSATDGSRIDADLGNVSGEGINLFATAGSGATVQTGDISSQRSGLNLVSYDSEQNVTTGDITAGSTGVYMGDLLNSNVTVQTGDITVDSSLDDTVYEGSDHSYVDMLGFNYGFGIRVGDVGAVAAEVTTGSITSDGVGIHLEAHGSESNVTIQVQDDLTADGAGIVFRKATDLDLFVPEPIDTAANQYDVLVDGTLSGGDTSILLYNTDVSADGQRSSDTDMSAEAADQISLTVWKVELNERGNAAESVDAAYSTGDATESIRGRSAAEEFEKKINYIIKLEQPEAGGTLEAVDASGNALNQSHGYDVANQDDTVMLKVNLDQGYELQGAFNGDGEKVALLKDAAGNYYVVVPKGGGVYLSVELKKTSDSGEEGGSDSGDEGNTSEEGGSDSGDEGNTSDEGGEGGSEEGGSGDDSGKTPATDPVNPWAYTTYEDPDDETMTYSEYVLFNQEVRDLVLNAKPGETVVVTTKRWMSFYSVALDALKARPDVTLIVQYRFAGQDFRFVVQAGTDCEALKNEDGYVGFLFFSKVLGAEIM